MFRGAIDYAAGLEDGRVELGGWALHFNGTAHSAADEFILAGANDYSVVIFDRPDIQAASHCGFRLLLSSAADLAALYWGGMRLQARFDDKTIDLQFWDRVENKVLGIIASHLTGILENRGEAEALRSAIIAGNTSQEIADLLDTLADNPIYDSIQVQVGGTGIDREVLVGKNGFLFLIGGANDVLSQYKRQMDGRLVASWVSLIKGRMEYCSRRDLDFLQIIVPEKQSVLPEFFPISIEIPTPLLSGVSRSLGDAPFYLDSCSILRQMFLSSGIQPFRKVDSHLSYFGAECLVRRIMQHFDIRGDIFPQKLLDEIGSGDLSSKLFAGNVVERLSLPDFSQWEFGSEEPVLKMSRIPAEGHIGTTLEWKAERPRTQKRLLVFGNSMFERGGAPLGLSWWVSRIFAETRFMWSASLLDEEVREFQPDVVICQTVERFLPALPNS